MSSFLAVNRKKTKKIKLKKATKMIKKKKINDCEKLIFRFIIWHEKFVHKTTFQDDFTSFI